MTQIKPWILLGLLLATCAGVSSAYADDSENFAGIGASVDVGHYNTDFVYPSGNYQANVSYYGMTFVQPVSQEVGFGLLAGYQTTGMDNPSLNTLGDGFGPFAGFFIEWQPELNDYWNLDLRAGYTWHDMSYTSNNQQPYQQADLTWYTSYVFLGPKLHYGPWRFSVGGYYQYISGSETDNGTINQQLDFSAAHSTGAYIGFDYYMNHTQSIGIYATGGAIQTVGLMFKVQF
ncbi:MAG: hypothetical protein WBR29_05000 [Gammaproteobacteria bacterium]